MGRRRTGTVYEKPEGSGRWWYSFLLRSGKRWTKPIPARPDGKAVTEADARAYKDEVLRRYASGAWDPEAPAPAPPAPMPTVAAYAKAWAETLTHISADFEKRIVRTHIEGTALGAMQLDTVEPQHVAAWVLELRAKPSQKGNGTLAPLTVRGIVHVLRKMFLAARFEKKLEGDPCLLPAGVLPPARDKVVGARRGWRYTRAEVETLISDVTIPLDRRVLYALFFLTGMRCGEAIVLRWSDFDPTRAPLGCITVQRGFNTARKVEKGTKTGAVREVPVHPTLAAMLAEWKLSGWAGLYGRRPEPDDLVVPTRGMKRRNGRNAYGQLQDDCTARGIRPRRLHGTRATFISLGIDDGARADILAKITHTKLERNSFDVYRNEAWETLCAEVAKIRIVRRADVLPLWKAVGGGGGEGIVSGDNATDSTTAKNSIEAAPYREAVFTQVPGAARNARIDSPAAETTGEQASGQSRDGADPGEDPPPRSDSATTGSDTPAIGPLTGEAMAYLWVEQLLARGEEL